MGAAGVIEETGRRVRRALKVFAFLCAAAGLALMVLFAAAGANPAQAADWVVNNDDTGFDPIPAGGTIVYSISVANDAPVPAPATTLTLEISAGGEFIGGTGTITGCSPVPAPGPAVVTCAVPALAPNAEVTLSASVLTSQQGTVTVVASVPTAGDTQPANNVASQSTTVNAGADMGIEVTGPLTAQTGSIAIYSFTATNFGPSPALGRTLTTTLPPGLTNIVTPPGCTLSGNVLSCSIPGPVPDGGSVSFDLEAQIAAPSASTLSLTATISGGTPLDPISGNNTDTILTDIQPGSDVSIAKSVAPASVFALGEEAVFTLTAGFTGDTPSNLVITDTIPANYSIESVTPSDPAWTCTVTGQLVTCTRASGGAPGANRPLGTITIVAEVVSTGPATNIANISASGPTDPVPDNNQAEDGGVLIQNPVADLRANKSGPNPALVVPGQLFTFSISTTNIPKSNPRSAPFTGTIFMRDTIPAGLEVTALALNGWTCSLTPSFSGQVDLVCERTYTAAAPLAVNATTPPVVLTSRATVSGSLVNSMEVTTQGENWPDNDLSNNVVSVGINSQPAAVSADVRMLKSRALATVPAGEIQTFTLEIVNDGPSTSSDVSVLDDLTGLINNFAGPTQAGFVSATVAEGVASPFACSSSSIPGSVSTRRLTCTIATLPVCTAGVDCPVITVEVRPGGSILNKTNTASATSNLVADPDRTNNASTVTYTLEPRADVTVDKTVSNPAPAAGQNLTYTIRARNILDGRSPAENVTITDTLPLNVTFISVTPAAACTTSLVPGSVTTPANNEITCNLGTIAQGAVQTVDIVVRPNTGTRGQTLVNSVNVTTSTLGDDPLNNDDSVAVTVGDPSIDLLVNKTDMPDPTSVGGTTTYQITVTNSGPSAAENVVVTDTLPGDGLVYLSHSIPSDGSCSVVPAVGSLGETLVCSFPLIGEDESRVIEVTMEGIAPGVFTNAVSVTSTEVAGGFDRNPGNNSVTENTTVRRRTDVEVSSKTADPASVGLGQTFTYTILIRNNTGTDPLTGAVLGEAVNVVLSDTLPANMVLAGAPSATVTAGTTDSTSCTGGIGASAFTCGFGTMSSGAEVTVTMPATVVSIAASPETFTNTARVATDSFDVNLLNNESSGDVTVTASSLSGTVFRDFTNDGVLNGGDTGVSGVTMTLAGTDLSGAPVTLTAVTGSDGSYSFPLVPPGSYSLTRGPVSEPGLTSGQAIPGAAGGSTSSADLISNIILPATGAATGYDFTLVPVAGIGLVKSVASAPAANPDGTFNVSFAIEVRNPSLEALDAIVLRDPLAGPDPLFGSFAASLTAAGQYTLASPPAGTCGGLNSGFNGASDQVVAQGFSLAPGASCSVTIALTVFPAAPPPSGYDNLATVTGEGSLSGEEVTSSSSASVSPPSLSRLGIAKVLASHTDLDGNGFVSPGDRLSYTVTATNLGNTALSDVVVTDDRITPNTATCASLAPAGTCVLTGSLTVTPEDAQAGEIVNTATADSNETDPVTASLTVPVRGEIDADGLTKTALVTTVKRGERVAYVIRASDVRISPVRIVDIMPPGFAFVAGSALANGTAVEPVIDGRRLTFDGLTPDAEDDITLELTLLATSAAATGDNVNRAELVDPTTGEVLATARARVTLLEEAVFDCSDVIGKVFDDQNRNGYQDEGEPGLPGVRLATVRGLLVTTDPHGRFSIACADIPDPEIGSNFIVKLDPRTLPTGYAVTTENPRKVRLTRGKMVKLNFGAALGRLVTLDLNAKVFEQGSDRLKPKWRAGLGRLIEALGTDSSTLRITYVGDDEALAAARIRAVSRDIAARWKEAGAPYRLSIESRIVAPRGEGGQ